MITELRLENFKSWRHMEKMRMAPITGLFGTNSSGKTSILQLLLMLKQTVDSPDRSQVLNLGDDKTPIALGAFRDVVFGHEKPGCLEWTLSWSLPEALKITDRTHENRVQFQGESMSFHAKVTENGSGRIAVSELEYALESARFRYQQKSETPDEYELTVSAGVFSFDRPRGRPWLLPAPIKCYGFPDQVRYSFRNVGFLSDLELEFERLTGRIYYLGPLREYPERQYLWAGGSPADMGRRGEKVIQALLALRERGEKMRLRKGKGGSQLIEAYIAEWLKKLGLIHEFSVKPITKDSNRYEAHVRMTEESSEVLITDVGFGLSQVLPVIVICYYVPEGSTILLEQPEIHLHPSVQENLADIFIDAVKRRKVQLIIESHSEHFLRRLQRRIAEEELKQEDVALYFTTMEGGESKLTPLDVDEYGNIRNWPRDFFGDDFGEIAETEKARLRRQIGKK